MTDVGALMSRLTLEVLEQTLFSQGLGREPSAFQRAVTSYFDTIGRLDPLDLLGAPAFLPRLGRRRGRGALEVLRLRRSTRSSTSAGRCSTAAREAPRDLLTLLLSAKDPESGRGMSDADMRANIVTFINAGPRNDRQRADLDALPPVPIARMARTGGGRGGSGVRSASGRPRSRDARSLRAVFEEALRLYPPAAMLSRQAIADDELAGVHIPAGAVITVSPYVLHRRRGLWDNPDAFDPSRFLGERRDRIDRFAYIPFGAGPRVCIGMAFAMQEGIILLANLLRAFRFDLVEGQAVMPHAAGDAAPARGMKMHVKRRDRDEEIHSGEFLCESALTEISPGPICASPNGVGALLRAAESAGYGNFPNALLPAERRGRRIFGRFLLRESAVIWNSSLN